MLFSRCPAAQTRIDSPRIAIAPPITSDRSVGVASHSTIAANTNPRNTRQRARKRVMLPPKRCSLAATTSSRVISLMQGAPRRHCRLWWHTQTAAREITTSCGSHGPLRSGHVGPYKPTTGVPIAAAMCSGPVSPDTTSAASRISTARSETDVAGAAVAAPDDARATASASSRSDGPQVTSDGRPRRSRNDAARAPNRSAGQRLFGHAAPGLSTMKPPRAAGGGDRRGGVSRGLRRQRHFERVGVIFKRREDRQILPDDVLLR